MKELSISSKQEGQRFDKFLLKHFNNAPKSFVYKMLRKKRIKLNGKKAEGNEIIHAGDTVQIYIADETEDKLREEKEVFESKKQFDIIYEDSNIIIVNKPAGLITHAKTSDDKNTLIDQIIYYLYRTNSYDPKNDTGFTPALCNRIDTNTSGIVIAGKNAKALKAMNNAIKMREADKFYIAAVCGTLKGSGEFRGKLVKDGDSNIVKVSHDGNGDYIITRYKSLVCKEGYTLLKIELVTGKSHQIRAHLKAEGFPIIGDRKYGNISENEYFRRKFKLSNQFLHAYEFEYKGNDDVLKDIKNIVFKAEPGKVLNNIIINFFGIDKL